MTDVALPEVLDAPLDPELASQSEVVANPVAAYLDQLAPGSQPAQRRALEHIASWASGGHLSADQFPWHLLRQEHTSRIRGHLVDQQAPATANRHLSAMRGVLERAWLMGQLDAESYHRAITIKNVKSFREPAGRLVDRGEIKALVDVCKEDTSPAGVRDAAILAATFSGGLRLAEIVDLQRHSLDLESGTLRVIGKGNKERTAYLQNGALAVTEAWAHVRGDQPGPLFCPVSQTGNLDIRQMTGQAVYMRFRRRADEAGIKRFSPHDGRRTWISNLLDENVDLATVQSMAGHASVTTTARYDRRGEERKRVAAKTLSFPWSD